MRRRICWPTFDLTCLQGGCIYCDDNPYRAEAKIRRAFPSNQPGRFTVAEQEQALAYSLGGGGNRKWKK